jgi:hypothetical protein
MGSASMTHWTIPEKKLKKELENKKHQILKNGKANRQDKRKKKANKMPL